MVKRIFQKLVNPLLIIGLAVVLRLIPHAPNFAPITATALFGGVYLSRRLGLIIPLATLLVSDYLLLYINPFSSQPFNFSYIHPISSLWYDNTIMAVYGSIAVSGLIGLYLKNHKSFSNILSGTLLASIQFFLITNAGVWLAGSYDRSILGLWQSYLAGIPFFKATLLGDLFYTGLFFGSYELMLYFVRKPLYFRIIKNKS